MRKNFVVISTILAMVLAPLVASVVPGRWEKVATLSAGTPVVVRLVSGDRYEVAFEFLTDDDLVVTDDAGTTVQLPTADVVEVSREIEDSTMNGTLIGTGVGFGVGFATAVAYEKSVTASGFRLAEENLSLALLTGLLGAGGGALAGWAVDRSTKETDVLYAAP